MRLHQDLSRPKGFLAACLLLLLAENRGYGYDLADRLATLDIDIEDPSHVYRALRTLQATGMVTSRWVTEGPGPARRVYEITPGGLDSLRLCAASIATLKVSADQYLIRYGEVQAASGSH